MPFPRGRLVAESGCPKPVMSARATDFLWFEWTGEGVFALFDRGTGETHLLDSESAAVLRALCARPADAAELGARLFEPGVMGVGEDWHRWLTLRLSGLIGLELVVAGD